MKVLSVLAVCVRAVHGETIKIGELTNLPYVSGTVLAIDDNTIAIENFNYDGAGAPLMFCYSFAYNNPL